MVSQFCKVLNFIDKSINFSLSPAHQGTIQICIFSTSEILVKAYTDPGKNETLPRIEIVPESGGKTPAMSLRSVLLPEPFLPIMPRTSPFSTLRCYVSNTRRQYFFFSIFPWHRIFKRKIDDFHCCSHTFTTALCAFRSKMIEPSKNPNIATLKHIMYP